MENKNIRTMEFIGEDDWNNNVYKCLENGKLYKSEELKNPEVYTCGNEFEGEMGFPVPKEWELNFINIPIQPTKEEKFNYMMLSRLQHDCKLNWNVFDDLKQRYRWVD